jgi:hypothetical protein
MYIPHLTARPSKSLLTVAIKVIYKFDGNAETSILYLSTYSPSQHEKKSNIFFTYNRVCLCMYHPSNQSMHFAQHCHLMAMPRPLFYISVSTPPHTIRSSSPYFCCLILSVNIYITSQIQNFNASAHRCHQSYL